MWIFLAFLAVPVIEIALFIRVGGLIGLWPTLALVVLGTLAGALVVRSQGTRTQTELRRAMAGLGDPAEPLAHGAMILLAGLLLMLPGFFTDACGLVLLIPQVRSAVLRWLSGRVRVSGFTTRSGAFADSSFVRRDTGPGVIDGDFHEIDPTNLPPRGPSGWTRH